MQEAPSSPPPSNETGDIPNSNLESEAPSLERAVQEQENKRAQQEKDPPPQERKDGPPQPTAKVFASVHRREQALVAKQQEIAQAQRAYQEREAQLAAREKALQSGKHDPIGALKAMGYEDPKEFLELMAKTGGEVTPEQRKLWELEARLKEKDDREAEWNRQREEHQARQQYEQEIGQWHNGIKQYVTEHPQWAQSLVSMPGQERQVLQVMQDHHARTGEQMEIDDAINQVNGAFEKKLVQGLQELVGHPRGKQLLEELSGKLSVGTRANVSSKAQTKPGITAQARNHTERYAEPANLSLDDMLQRNSRILREESRRI